MLSHPTYRFLFWLLALIFTHAGSGLKTALVHDELKPDMDKALSSLHIQNDVLKREFILEVISDLEEQDAALTYFIHNDHTYGMLIRPRQLELKDLGKAKSMQKNVSAILEAIKSRKKYRENAERLFCQIMAPFDPAEIRQLIIIPCDELANLPFEVLVSPLKNKPLQDICRIRYRYPFSGIKKPATRDLPIDLFSMAPAFTPGNDDINGTGIELVRERQGYLPKSKTEVETISALFRGEHLTEREATESNFKLRAPRARIIHIATHGVYDTRYPDRSHLVFYSDECEDGKLYLQEIAKMDLSADLITLSACNTGYGILNDADQLETMGRSFAQAGCHNQIISLWEVNDETTAILMQYYYGFLKEGYGKGTAMNLAKQSYIEAMPRVFRHPFYWAGFVYYGNDLPLNMQENQ